SFVALVLGLAPARQRGLAGGILTTSIFLGQFCSPLVTTPLIASYGYAGLFRATALLVAAMSVAAGVAGAIKWMRARSVGRL
ncbi:MFS transporter, partial [Rhizobiaceae sp. 2RAB30]